MAGHQSYVRHHRARLARFVFPVYLLHVALTLAAIQLLPFGGRQLLLAELDAFVSTGALVAALLLNATVFCWVSGEAIPAPLPFGTTVPDTELVAQATAAAPWCWRRGRHG